MGDSSLALKNHSVSAYEPSDWINDLVEMWQAPKPKHEIEVQPVSSEELRTWNNLAGRLSACKTVKFVHTCSMHGDRHYLRISYNRCNERSECPRCAWYNARKEAWTTWYWLKHNLVTRMPFKVYVTHIVLTLPKYMQNITDKKLISAVRKLMTHPTCKTAYSYVIQNYSSKNPFEKHKHVHVLALNIGQVETMFSTNDDRKYQYRRLRPYFNVDRLRQRWKEILGVAKDKPVDVHVNYTSFWNKGKVVNWLAYMYRYDAWDVFKFLIRAGGNGGRSPPFILIYDSSMLSQRLSLPKKRVSWVGFLASTNRKRSVECVGLYYSTKEIRQKIKKDAMSCPYKDESGHVCGAILQKLEDKEINELAGLA